jgi:hypothetical protein
MRLLWLALLLVGTPLVGQAQEPLRPDRGTGLWTSAGIKADAPGFLKELLGKDAYKDLRTGAEIGYRSGDELADGGQLFVDLSARYKVNKHVSIGLEQRAAFRQNTPTRHRTGVKLMLAHDIDRLKLGYRFTYQHNYREWGEVRELLRNRFELGYDIPKFQFDPDFSMELFTWAGYRGWGLIGTRYQLGTSWSPMKDHDIGVAIVHDREVGVAFPDHRWILSLSYTVDIR